VVTEFVACAAAVCGPRARLRERRVLLRERRLCPCGEEEGIPVGGASGGADIRDDVEGNSDSIGLLFSTGVVAVPREGQRQRWRPNTTYSLPQYGHETP